MLISMLDQERALFDAHRDAWLRDHRGEFALVKTDHVIGFFEQQDDALAEGARLFGLDSFLVRQVEEKEAEVFIPALALGILGAHP